MNSNEEDKIVLPCPTCMGNGDNPLSIGKGCSRCLGTGEIILEGLKSDEEPQLVECLRCGGSGADPIQSHIDQIMGGKPCERCGGKGTMFAHEKHWKNSLREASED